jgi:hypothetical protein
MSKKAIQELSADNAVLISELSRVTRGSTVTYTSHFTEWLGRPIRNRGDMPNFTTVETRLRTDYGIVLSVIHGKGYKVLTHSDTVTNDNQIDRARRAAARRKKELATVEVSELNDQQRLTYVCKVAQAHLVEEAGREKSLRKIAAVANGSTTPLALGHALEALKKNL